MHQLMHFLCNCQITTVCYAQSFIAVLTRQLNARSYSRRLIVINYSS